MQMNAPVELRKSLATNSLGVFLAIEGKFKRDCEENERAFGVQTFKAPNATGSQSFRSSKAQAEKAPRRTHCVISSDQIHMFMTS